MSTIDHFFVNDDIVTKIKDAGVIHHPDNMSDHSHIYLKLDVQNDLISSNVNRSKPEPKPNWKRSPNEEKENYRNEVESMLNNIEMKKEAMT